MRFAVAIAGLAASQLAGCFYVESINQRPSLDITQPVVGDIFRNESVSFHAIVVDPDGHDVDLTWRAYLCTDASTFESCDDTTDIVGEGEDFTFTVPGYRLDGTTPTGGLRLVLDGRDDHGATAKPTDQLQLAVKDRNPELSIRDTSVYHQMGKGYVVDMPINLYALFTDGDDALDSLVVEWKVLPPSLVTVDLTDDEIASPDEDHRQVAKILKPQIPGLWGLSVTVTDPGGHSVTKEATLNVIPDSPPCIDVVAPIVPPPSASLIVMDQTLFEVPGVSDDLDAYPRKSGGALFGEPTFVWSVLGPTGGRQIVSGASSNMLFDPDIYTPGTLVEVRVEIQDRKLAAVNCADANQTCSIGANSCIQRQTWRVEAR